MVKYYYENALASQNIKAKPSKVWVADITTLKILDRTFQSFLCIDIHTNCVVAHLIRATTNDSKGIISVLTKAINKRFVVPPKTKLILNLQLYFKNINMNSYLGLKNLYTKKLLFKL